MSMVVPFLPDLKSEIQLNTLYSLENLNEEFWLTNYNLVYDKKRKTIKNIGILNIGYPYMSFSTHNKTKTVTLHKILALARINNGPYECIEHINDNPLDARICNLRFSTQRENALSAFKNGRRDCPEAIFRVEFVDGSIHVGTINEISKKTNTPRQTLYCRYYKGPFIGNPQDISGKPLKVLSVIKIKEAPEQKKLSFRSIDYPKVRNYAILILDRIQIPIIRETE